MERKDLVRNQFYQGHLSQQVHLLQVNHREILRLHLPCQPINNCQYWAIFKLGQGCWCFLRVLWHVSEGREATSQIFRKALKGGINLTLDDLISLKEKNFLVGVSKCQSLLIIHFKRCYTSGSVFFSSKNKPLSQQNGFSVCDPCTLSTLSLAPTGKQAPQRP